MLLNFFKKKQKTKKAAPSVALNGKSNKESVRKGELGEYKIDIQLAQLPASYKYISDVMLENSKSISGYSQIDHIVISPFGIYIIETKNYQGTIYGNRERKEWSVNGKFKMMNPFNQNYGHVQIVNKLLKNKYQDHFISIVSFTKRSTFKVEEELRKITSNELLVYDVELSEFIHRKAAVLKLQLKNPVIDEEESENILYTLKSANISDNEKRKMHINSIQGRKSKSTNDHVVGNYKCTVCNEPVSQKVAAYCFSSKKFEDKIYCYDHQNLLNRPNR